MKNSFETSSKRKVRSIMHLKRLKLWCLKEYERQEMIICSWD